MKTALHRLAVSLIALMTIAPAAPAARAADADSIVAAAPAADDATRFRPARLAVPAALITVGALGVGVKPLVRARKWVNHSVGLHRCDPVDDIAQYLPLASYLALDYCGADSRRPIADRALTAATGFIIMSALTQATKFAVDEPRPRGTHRGSFPSGHTATAFLGAELVRADYGTWPGVAAYTVATAVAVMRILNQRHWTNDLIAGAGIGILSARAALWLLPLERRLLRLDRHAALPVIVPAYDPASRTLALTAAIPL